MVPTHYWINLARCTKRRAAMEAQFTKYNIPHRRIDAIAPSTMPTLLKPIATTPRGILYTKASQYACLCSHLKAMACALEETRDPWVLIVEDDMALKHRVEWKVLFASAPCDALVLQLFVVNPRFYEAHCYKLSHRWIPWKQPYWSCGVYAVKRHYAKTLVKRYGDPRKGKVNLRNVQCKPVADVLLYQKGTYSLNFPVYMANPAWKSTVVPVTWAYTRVYQLCLKMMTNGRKQRPAFLHPHDDDDDDEKISSR